MYANCKKIEIEKCLFTCVADCRIFLYKCGKDRAAIEIKCYVIGSGVS